MRGTISFLYCYCWNKKKSKKKTEEKRKVFVFSPFLFVCSNVVCCVMVEVCERDLTFNIKQNCNMWTVNICFNHIRDICLFSFWEKKEENIRKTRREKTWLYAIFRFMMLILLLACMHSSFLAWWWRLQWNPQMYMYNV